MNLDNFVDIMIKEEGINNKEDLNNLFDELQGKFYQALLEGEMDYHLGYEKSSHNTKVTTNRRNGHSSKNKIVKTKKGEFKVNMPRDRDGSFEPTIIPKRKRIIADFKKIYTASNKIVAEEEYESFLIKYKDNKRLIKKVTNDIEHIMQLFDYPAEIRKIIYTTNPIESLNSALRKVTNGKGSFIHNEALLKVLYLRVLDLEKKWLGGIKGWNKVLNQLFILFEKRITNYIDI